MRGIYFTIKNPQIVEKSILKNSKERKNIKLIESSMNGDFKAFLHLSAYGSKMLKVKVI